MTWSLTLAGLPFAGAKSKLHIYKQKVQEIEGLPKMIFTEKPFDDFRQNKMQFLAYPNNPVEHTALKCNY